MLTNRLINHKKRNVFKNRVRLTEYEKDLGSKIWDYLTAFLVRTQNVN